MTASNSKERRSEDKILHAIGLVSVLSLVSKATGFLREIAIAGSFGASDAVDAYRVAQNVPNTLFASFGAALSTVIVPMFSDSMLRYGRGRAISLAQKISSLVVLLVGVLSIVGFLLAPWLVRIFAPGFGTDTRLLTLKMTRFLMPCIITSSLAFLSAGILQSHNEFRAPALMGLPLNMLIIILVPILAPRFGINVLLAATLLGLIGQFAIQIPSLTKRGFRFKWDPDFRDPSVRQTAVLVVPVILGTAVLSINAVVDRAFASSLPAGSISILDYSSKLTGLVISIVISAVATVSLPKFSRTIASGQREPLASEVGQAIAGLNALILPMATGLAVLRVPIVRFVFERGAFTPQATRLTALALLFGSIGLPGYGMREIAARAFYALKDTVTPMVNGVAAVLINVVLLFVFVGHLQWGVAGMALATSCSVTLAGLMLAFFLRRKLGHLSLNSILSSFWRSGAATSGMALVLWKTYPVATAIIPGGGFLAQAFELSSAAVIGGAVYLFVLTLLRAPEARLIWSIARRLRARMAPNGDIGKQER